MEGMPKETRSKCGTGCVKLVRRKLREVRRGREGGTQRERDLDVSGVGWGGSKTWKREVRRRRMGKKQKRLDDNRRTEQT